MTALLAGGLVSNLLNGATGSGGAGGGSPIPGLGGALSKLPGQKAEPSNELSAKQTIGDIADIVNVGPGGSAFNFGPREPATGSSNEVSGTTLLIVGGAALSLLLLMKRK